MLNNGIIGKIAFQFRTFWIVSILLSAFAPAFCQYRDFVFRHLSITDGLSQSSVISITQDEKELLWFGTRDGLNKYDGREFTVYRNSKNDSSSISNNDISALITDSDGDLWVGTFNGLNRYIYAEDRFERFFNNKDSTSLSDNIIVSIVESSDGSIWVGTANGLNRYNKKTGTFQRYYHIPQNENSLSNNYINNILEDNEGSIWVATAEGLNKLNIHNHGEAHFTRYTHQPGNANSLSDNFIHSIAEDNEGNLWVGTKYGGLNTFNKSNHSFEVYQHDPGNSNSVSSNDIRCILFDGEGKLWIGTYSGLNLFDVREKSFLRLTSDKDDPNTLSKNAIKSLFIDVNGSLWIGAFYGGVNMLDRQNSNFKNYRYKTNLSGLSFDVISALLEDLKGNIFIGTEGGGINVLNGKSKKFEHDHKNNIYSTLSNQNIKSLLLDQKQNLLIGTYNEGLTILNLATNAIKRYQHNPKVANSLSDDDIYSIAQQDDSLFWIGTHGGGLNLFNVRTGAFTHYREGGPQQLTSDLIRVIYKDSKGNLWIGAQYGLNFLSKQDIEKRNIHFKHYFFDHKTLSGEHILTIFEDSQSRIWVGSNESGLNVLDQDKDRFLNYNLSKGAGAVYMVHGILEDARQNLWISTNQGILMVNPADSTFKKFDVSDGLVANEYNNNSCLKTRTGEMYFGSLQGITNFHPDSIITNQHTPPVVLTDFKLFGQSVKTGSKDGVLKNTIAYTRRVDLDHDQAIFTINFAIPSYINPQRNRYAYRLRGLEEQWNFTQNTSATYTIQRAGTYVFEVRGANNDDVWNDATTTLMVTVNPAPWRTWWAFLIYGLIISICLYLLVNTILSRSRYKHELELEHANSEKEKSLTQMKLQFFTNISHEFRNPLVLIVGPLEQVITDYKGSNRIYKQLQVIEKNAKRLLKLIDQLMDFRKFENNHFKLRAAEGNIVDFVKEIYVSFKEYARLHRFHYEFSSDSEHIPLWYDRDKMERVIYNLISNAFKYTPDHGKIHVSVQRAGERVEIAVTDTGIGIEQEHLEKIFERFYEVRDHGNPMNTKYRKGTGIGLALAKGIVDLHLGKIHVESKKDAGSIFTVSLPTGKDHLSEDQIIKDFKTSDDIIRNEMRIYLEEGNSTEVVDVPDLPKQAATILVVEDNDEVREYIVQIFRTLYNVKEATNGKEGLEEALHSVPDIIVSDVMMPDMDGIEFCSRIKSDIKTSHIPFILLTARTSFIFKLEGLEMGADEYISKPFNIKELKLKVANILNTQKRLKEKFASESIVKPGEITVSTMDEKLLEKAMQIVENNIANEQFDIPTFCEDLGVSRTMLFTKIKAWTNLTPNEFIQVMRIKRAAQLLEQNKLNISQVGFHVGFKNPKYFSKCFQRHFSITPTEYAKKFASPMN